MVILQEEVKYMQLAQKETSLLKDLKDQEQICVEKYSNIQMMQVTDNLKICLLR
jgi:hypothetical protein